VRAPTLETLRRRVGMVTQDVQLFQASVRDNLTFFDSTIPDARIHAVIADLELSDWYAALPDGLDTEIEAGGRSLSAGEAQLLAFARVFLRDPGLVILDEASSRLDPATEQRIERAVDKLLRDRTALIIAHRLGTIHRADDVLILERGRILEYGNRAQLAAGWVVGPRVKQVFGSVGVTVMGGDDGIHRVLSCGVGCDAHCSNPGNLFNFACCRNLLLYKTIT